MQVRLRAMRYEAEGANSYELEALPGASLPPFTAGAHIDVTLAPGLTRSYSLANNPAERGRYRLGVLLETESRGGSRHVHERWRVGDILEVTPPINDFPLHARAAHSVLIAGGIGITPILAMAEELAASGRSWTMHYVCRTRARAAFLERVEAFPEAAVYFDAEPGGGALDLAGLIGGAPAGSHLYCCGPAGLLAAFETAMQARPDCAGHIERFAAAEAPAAQGGFRLILRRSGRTIDVLPGQTMLDALLDAGVDAAFACTNGICGTCETKVLAGVPDHRDDFLTDAEKAANAKVMVCCSGARTPTLELDL